MATTNETGNEVVEENLDLPEVKEGEEDSTDWKAEALKLREKAIASKERAKTLREKLAEKEKAIEALATGSKKEASSSAPNGLDDSALDYLDAKGVSEAEDISVIEAITKKTGMTVRQALKDEYVQAKLKANQAAREVKAAMPTATKRGGTQGDTSFEIALAEYKDSGYTKLPKDFKLKLQVINATQAHLNTNKPAWHA